MSGRRGNAAAGPGGPIFWLALAAGWAVIGFGVAGVLGDPWLAGQELVLARWVLLAGLTHDTLVLPVAAAGWWALGRVLPVRVRGPVRGALGVSAIVVAFAVPLLRGFGRRPLNASALPGDYAVSVAVLVASVWAVAAAVAVVRTRQAVRGGGR